MLEFFIFILISTGYDSATVLEFFIFIFISTGYDSKESIAKQLADDDENSLIGGAVWTQPGH